MRCGPFHLHSIELGIEPTTCYQVVVCSFLEDYTILEHNDFIGVAERAQAMRASNAHLLNDVARTLADGTRPIHCNDREFGLSRAAVARIHR